MMTKMSVFACSECNSDQMAWSITLHNLSGVVDGRLRLNEVGALLTLSCEECSATLLLIDADSNEGMELLARIGEP